MSANNRDWRVEVMADGLDYPCDLERSGDHFLATEAADNIVGIGNGALKRRPLRTSDPIAREGEAGLLGRALANDCPTSGRAFFYHTYRHGGSLANKIIEERFDGRGWYETRGRRPTYTRCW